MSALTDGLNAIAAQQARQDAAITGISGDVSNLTAQIAALQASIGNGQLSAADQALLDSVTASAASMTARLEALDAQTPPVP